MKFVILGCLLSLMILMQAEASLGEADKLSPECFACRCPRNLDYECGSDGRTYQNDCLFKCAQEKCPDQTRSVVITKKGRCEDDENDEIQMKVVE